MATVMNKADPGAALDKALTKYNRENAGNPNGSLTPQFSGEIVLDTTYQVLWQAQDTSNNSWVLKTPSLFDGEPAA